MALVGDILIKLVADFAEFAKGMEESKALLEGLGKKADTISGQIEGAFKAIKGAAAVEAITEAVKTVLEELERLQKKFVDIAEGADKLGLSFDKFEALRVAALKVGVGVDDLTASMTKLKGVTEQAIQGNGAVIASLNKLGVTILDTTGKQRSQEEINRRIAEAFIAMPAGIEKLRLQYQLLGEAGEATDKKLRLLATTTQEAADAIASSGLSKAVEDLKKVEDRSKAAKEQWDLLVGSLVLPLKASFLDGFTTGLERLNAAIIAFDYTKAENIIKLLTSPGEMARLGGAILGSSDPIKDRLDELQKQADGYKRRIDAATAPDAGIIAKYSENIGKLNDLYYNTLAEINRIKVQAGAQTGTYPAEGGAGAKPFGNFADRGGSNPSVVNTGGGRSDAETVDTLIQRYTEMRKAAEAAQKAVRDSTEVDIRDLSLKIEAQQAAAEAVAKIEQRLGSKLPEQQKKDLEQAIFLQKQAAAEQQRATQYAVQADATERRLGDGTRGLAFATEELNRQYASGRLHIDAYHRALAEMTEQQEHTRLQAKRYDDDLGSLVAGFQDAALSYQRSNDLFTQGGQLFTGITSAMGDGLDILLGKSTKTFAQIASDFATMLAKMALQAALSPIFKYLSTALGSWLSAPGGSGITVTPLPPLSTPTARAGGGDTYGGQPYWVGEYGPERFVPAGAGRIEPAGGGDVYVSVTNYTDSSVSTKKSKGPGGQMQVDIIVEAVEGRMSARLSRGQGALGRTMEGKYGLQPVGR